MKLNIGCSNDPWGDVRVDINSVYLGGKSQANVFADAQRIPFKNYAFDETKAWNILEHLPNWEHAISEWCRVTQRKLEIEVPTDPGFVNLEIFAEIFCGNFYGLRKLPERRLEHLWKFTPNAIMSKLKQQGFTSALYFETAPLFFRDPNRLVKNKLVSLLRQKQPKLKYGYRIVAYRENPL